MLPDPLGVVLAVINDRSQCTYRCVVLPDFAIIVLVTMTGIVSMHLQVRGAP